MTKLLKLLKITALGTFGINKARHANDPKEKSKLTRLCFLMFLSCIIFLIYPYVYSENMARSLAPLNLMYIQLGIMMAVSSSITLFFSITMVKGTLFGFKDYDILMSLPITYKTIITSRVLILYFTNIFFVLIILLPASFVYVMNTVVTPWFFVSFILSFFFIPLIPIIVATIIGTLITVLTARMKYTNFFSTFLYFIFFIGIMALSFSMNYSMENFADIGQMIMPLINRIYPLTTLYINAVCNGDILSLLLFIAIGAVLFAIYIFVIALKFKQINGLITSKRTVGKFTMVTQNKSSQKISLLKKELRVYFSSQVYIFNTLFGMIFLLIGTGAAIFYKNTILEFLPMIEEMKQNPYSLLGLGISMFVVLTCTTCCSISFEGKNLWIIKSSPIKTTTVFLCKLAVNWLVTIPVTLICGIVFSVLFSLNPLQILIIIITPIIYSLFSSGYGLLINLYIPNLTWKTETEVIKQSLAATVSTLSLMIIGIIPIILCFYQNIFSVDVFVLLTCLVMGILTVFIYIALGSKGVKMFEKL